MVIITNVITATIVLILPSFHPALRNDGIKLK